MCFPLENVSSKKIILYCFSAQPNKAPVPFFVSFPFFTLMGFLINDNHLRVYFISILSSLL